ncbi:MAG: DUF885 domain-containing protein [Clostridiales Family XIII bacterium]|jgi:uncharacterized protein (DUF885 family)|nr:DUF885 domain-containing protein [Clostridiales Family XIII bacterium]
MIARNRTFLFLLTFVILLSALAGCGKNREQTSRPDDPSFTEFTGEVFRHYAASDSLSLNYLLVHPENYGIEKPQPTFGTYGREAFTEDLLYAKTQLEARSTFDYASLSDEQQLTYDILFQSLEESVDAEKFLYFGDVLSPTIGLQAQLPILLAEYSIYEKADFDYYLALLETLPAYFDQIIAFEREKKEAGTFMAKSCAENVVKQIEGFISNPDANLLIVIFDERVNAFDGLTEEEKSDFRERNRTAVLNAVIPAYRAVADALTELNADNTRTGGLSSLENGAAYYEWLVKASTGSAKTVSGIEAMIDDALSASIEKIREVYQSNPSAYDQTDAPDYPASEPNEILDYLKGAIPEMFPALDDDGYILKSVDKSLEDFASPAFYLLPPIDDPSRNIIYINNGAQTENSNLFSTLAHEGYPGHLYQTVYFRKADRDPVRSILSFDGYIEGWATYVERMSYELAGLDADVAAVLAANDLATLCMYAKVDIGVNAHAWDLEDVALYLSEFGISNEEATREMYDAMVAEPANYLKYTVGCIEILQLKNAAREAWGSDFKDKTFHEFLLGIGPATFDVISDRLDRRSADGSVKAAA